MGAFVEEKFKGGFLLDEGKLRKISDLIERRLGKTSLIFKVFRGDSYSYETPDIDTVINEDNEDWRAITKLELLTKDVDGLDFKLIFSGNGASIYITGNDRDSVFLMYSDLREYMRSDVLTRQPLTERRAMFIVMLFALTPMLVATIAIVPGDIGEREAVLASSELSLKINYLIGQRKNPFIDHGVYWFIAFMALPLLVSLGVLEGIWKFIFPSNQFLFGERAKKYFHRKSLINKVFWGVGVALVVSIVASIIVWRLTL